MSHRYDATVEQPYHLSVAAILYNQEKQIAVHRFDFEWNVKDLMIVMRETLEVNERLEDGIARGLREEFGATGEIERFLGSQISSYKRKGVDVEKTTLYFWVRLIDFHPEQRLADDPERHSSIEWHDPQWLIDHMHRQGAEPPLSDESIMIRRALQYLK